jgi:hypothetical protein
MCCKLNQEKNMSMISDLINEVKKVSDEGAEIVRRATKASIDFRNETDDPIRVDMDNGREIHEIVPHGATTFSEAHLLDAPTFRVINIADGRDIFGRQINVITTPHLSLGFNGTFF